MKTTLVALAILFTALTALGDTRQMVWDRLFHPLDRRRYDVGAFLKELPAADYTGPVGFQGFGIKEDAREVLARTMNAWKTFRVEIT